MWDIQCYNSKIEMMNPLCLILFSLCAIFFICNIIGLIKMFIIERKIRFEKYVLISGIFEISLIILFIVKIQKEIIQDIIQSLQIFITLYISRQFLALYINIEHSLNRDENDNDNENNDNKTYGKHIYNTYFWILSTIIIILIIARLLIDILIKEEKFINNIVDFLNDLICLIISIILLIFSWMVRKIITIKSNEINDDDIDNKIYLTNEKYLNTRKVQILIIALGNMITDFIEVIISLFKEIICNTNDNNDNEYLNFFDTLTLYSLAINTFLNFIAFFFIVRDSFHIEYIHTQKKEKSPASYLLTKTIIEKDVNNKYSNKDIEYFFSEENDEEKKEEDLGTENSEF